MNKNLKKILVAGASLLMFASVGTGIGSLSSNDNVHAAYWNTPTDVLRHGVTIRGRYWPAGTKLYDSHGADFMKLPDGRPTPKNDLWCLMGSPLGPQVPVPTWAMHRGYTHHRHHHYHHHVKYLYQIRPDYSTKTYNRLFKRLVREMEAHGMHYDSSNETGRLNHKGRYIELTGTNTGVVTNGGATGIKPLWPDQALNLLHRMYRHTTHHYRPIHRHHFHHIKKHAHKSKRHVKKLGAVKANGGFNVYTPKITPQIANSNSSKPMIRAWKHGFYVNHNLMNKVKKQHQTKRAQAFRKASLYDIKMMKFWEN